MTPADRPRQYLCGACVRARGLERGDAHERVVFTLSVSGQCDDCRVSSVPLEVWRRKDVPPPDSTLPALPATERD